MSALASPIKVLAGAKRGKEKKGKKTPMEEHSTKLLANNIFKHEGHKSQGNTEKLFLIKEG